MATRLARLDCDEITARRIAALLADSQPGDAAVSAFERDGGWTVELHFSDDFPHDVVRALFAAAAGKDAVARLQFDKVAQRDWIRASLDGLSIVHAGRFIVHGAHHRGEVAPNAIGIEIEAALAFGTGHHGTTRGCLLAIDALAKRGRRRHVLDVGTGTGVLAIAAARAFHGRVFATDIDPVAVRVAKANARHNRAGALIALRVADGRRGIPGQGRFDLILANILLGPLTRMARPLASRLAPGGRIVLSGLLPEQANAALAAYRAQGLALERRMLLDGWVTLLLARKN